MTDKEQITNNFAKDINVPHKEQIIIDGIDVTNCNYIIDYDPSSEQGTWCGAIHKGACRIHSKDCKYNPNCYFKQLVRKTQECENLRGSFHDTNEQLKDYKEHYDKQSEEYQKLKQDLFLAQNQITLKNEYIQKVKQECEELKDYARRQENQRETYYKEFLKKAKALEKIEAHFEHRCNICREDYGMGTDCAVCWKKDIKDIINKAKTKGE